MPHQYSIPVAGHVFGYNLITGEIDWDFFIGSDLDGSVVYIVKHDMIDNAKICKGPDGETEYPMPVLVAKLETGPSISSPVITANRVVAAGYDGLYLYSYDNSGNFTLMERFYSCFEASPVIWNNRIYIASRDGYLYCFGIK